MQAVSLVLHLQAIEADPGCAKAHVAACVAKGRLTFFVDNRKKVQHMSEGCWRLTITTCCAQYPRCDSDKFTWASDALWHAA